MILELGWSKFSGFPDPHFYCLYILVLIRDRVMFGRIYCYEVYHTYSNSKEREEDLSRQNHRFSDETQILFILLILGLSNSGCDRIWLGRQRTNRWMAVDFPWKWHSTERAMTSNCIICARKSTLSFFYQHFLTK